jgi:hypothetical protein
MSKQWFGTRGSSPTLSSLFGLQLCGLLPEIGLSVTALEFLIIFVDVEILFSSAKLCFVEFTQKLLDVQFSNSSFKC